MGFVLSIPLPTFLPRNEGHSSRFEIGVKGISLLVFLVLGTLASRTGLGLEGNYGNFEDLSSRGAARLARKRPH